MKTIFLFFAMFFAACGPALDANNFGRNSNETSNTNATPAGTPDAALIKQLEVIAKESKGKVGVSAVLIETGETVGINRIERFAMQSVVKLPISMAVLRQVELGEMARVKILISKDDMVPSGMRSPIRDKSPNGVEMSVQELIKFAISESDGTAADVLQRVAGGATGVQSYIDSMNTIGMEVKWSHKEFSKDWNLQYENFATPDAAVWLVLQIFKGTKERSPNRQAKNSGQETGAAQPNFIEYGVSKENAELLLKFMTESNNPDGRIKGLLPPGTVVAHKTGTGGTRDGVTSATNDIGIITLPNGNHIAIAVFVGDSTGDQKIRESVIAKISRAIFDKWNK